MNTISSTEFTIKGFLKSEILLKTDVLSQSANNSHLSDPKVFKKKFEIKK